MKSIYALVLALLFSCHLYGHDDHAPVKTVTSAEMHAPSALPDRIILTWSGDPRTSQAVTWRTSTQVHHGYAEIAIATANPNFIESAQRFPATREALKTDLNEAHFHSVAFQSLQPGTRYAYRVGDGTNWSEWFHFSTAPATPEPFSFIYFGDAQNDLRARWSRVIREAILDAPKAAFFLHAGDLVNRANADGEWGDWFDAGDFLNAMIPSVPLPGNHEYARSLLGVRGLSSHWRPQFTLPTNGPEGLEESCYTLVYGNVRIIALNSNEDYQLQGDWLRKVLEENTATWVICSFHHPVFSTGNDRDNKALRNAWKPILDEFNVDLVLQGHDHTYGRTGTETPTAAAYTKGNVPTGLTNIDTHTGTVYVVSVSGPKMYNLSKESFMPKTAANTQLYQIIHIDGDELVYEARTAVGELYDRFTLKKREGLPNEIQEDLAEQHAATSK